MTSSELEMSKEHGATSPMINYCCIMVLNATIPLDTATVEKIFI